MSRKIMKEATKLVKMGRFSQAIECYESILASSPENVDAMFGLAKTAGLMGSFDLAEKGYRTALLYQPNSLEISTNLGIALFKQQRHEEAIETFTGLLSLYPEAAEVWTNLGAVVADLGKLEDAEEFYNEALRLAPSSVSALANMAELRAKRGDLIGSLALLDQLKTQQPSNQQIRFNRAETLLALGKLKEGWVEVESRLKVGNNGPTSFDHKLKRWHGRPLEDRSILLTAEQGVGDQISFSSIVPDFLKLAKRVVLEVEPRLVALMQSSFPAAEVVPINARHTSKGVIYSYDWDVNKLDYHTPLLSAYRYLRADVADFPTSQCHLSPSSEADEYWKAKLSKFGDAFKVGVCWRGALSSEMRKSHYPPLETWRDVFSHKNVEYFNLMYDECSADVAQIERDYQATLHTFDEIDYRDDFMALAALSKNLDAVVSVSCAPGLLAAAVGCPTTMILKRGHWVLLGTDRMPMLPDMDLALFDDTGEPAEALVHAEKWLSEKVG